MKLWEVSEKIEWVLANEVDKETGEITDDTLKALDDLELQRDELVLQIAKYVKGELAESKAVAEQASILSTRAKRHEKRAANLTFYLQKNLPEGQELRDPTVRIHWRKSNVIEPRWPQEDLSTGHIPDEYLRKKVTLSIDKKKAKEDLKNGKEIIGLLLVEKNTLKLE